MAITGRTATVVENASTTSITATLPTNRQTGDLVIAVFVLPGTPGQFSGPGTGWTQFVAPTFTGAAHTIAAYYRFSPPSAPSASTTAAADRASVVCQAYAGVDPVTPIDVTAAVTTGLGSSLVCTGVTTGTDDALVVSGYTINTASRTPVLPGGMTEVASYSATTVGKFLSVADESRPTAGATGTRTWSFTPSTTLDQAGFVVGLRSAAASDVVQTSTASITAGATVSSSGTTYVNESFTGSDSDPWPAIWIPGQTGSSGAYVAIVGNRGRMASGTQGGFSNASRIARRLDISPVTNVEVSGTWRPTNTEPNGLVHLRADDALNTQNGYHLRLNRYGHLEVYAAVNYVDTVLGSFNFTANADTTYGFRFRAVGNSIKARVWQGTEPETWQVDVIDTRIPGSGAVGIGLKAGSAAVAHVIDWDDILITNGQPGGESVTRTSTVTISASTVSDWSADVAMTSTVARSSSAGQAHTADVDMTSIAGISSPQQTVIPWALSALILEVSWDGATWTDLSDRLLDQVKIQQGRATFLDDIGPASASFTLSNDDGSLTPGNADSPYWPNIRYDRQVRITAVRGASESWTRFQGWIRSIEPDFPGDAAVESVVHFTAVDTLGLVATKESQSAWVNAAKYYAGQYNTRYDSFVMRGRDDVGRATSYVDNVTTSPGEKARAVVVPYTSIDEGPLSFGAAEGLSMDGAVTFSPSETGHGSIIKITTPHEVRAVQFYLKCPGDLQAGSPTNPTSDVLYLGNGEGSAQARLLLADNGSGIMNLDFYDGAATYWGLLASGVATNNWVRITLATNTANPNTTDCYYDGPGGTNGGGFVNIPYDLRNASYLWFGGFGQQPIGASVAGITILGNEAAIVPVEFGRLDGNLLSVANLMAFVSWEIPGGLASTIGTQDQDPVHTGRWHERTIAQITQIIGRTGRGIVWVDPQTGKPRLWTRDVCYPATPFVTVDTEEDLIGPPRLLFSTEGQPTRMRVDFPGGSATVIDTERETASAVLGPGSEQVVSSGVETYAASYTQSETIAEELLSRVGLGMRIREMTVDLERSTTNHISAFFGSTTDPTDGIRPTQRIRLKVPRSHFGVNLLDLYVEGWEEIYDLETGFSVKLDLIPASPPTGLEPLRADVRMGISSTIGSAVTGGTTPTGSIPTSVQIGSATRALDGVNPTSTTFPGGRGTNELILYRDPLTITVTNIWGVEVQVSSSGTILAVNDRQTTGSATGTSIPAGGYVLSGHGTSRDWLLQNATVGANVVLVSGTGGGGTTPGPSPWQSTMPYALGVYSSGIATAHQKVVDFAAMAGVQMDFVDRHPGWDGLATRANWFYSPHAGQGYNIMISLPMYGPDGVGVDHTAYFSNLATDLNAAGFTAPYWRIGVEFNIAIEGNATDGNWTTWVTRWRSAVQAIKAIQPNAKIVLCVNEGTGGGGSISQANILNIVNQTADLWDILGVDYYDQYEAITNDAQRDARFGTSTTFGTINYWLQVARDRGRKLGIPEWGVASGTQWAGHTGGDNPYYINALMDWAGQNSDTVQLMCYFEEPAAYLKSDITTTATNPNARAEFQANIAQWKDTTAPPPEPPPPSGGGGGSYPAKTVSVYKMMFSGSGPNIASIPSGANVIRLAFAQGSPPSLVGWGAQGQASALADIAAKRAAGVRFIISVGGSGGAVNTSARATFLSGIANIYNALQGNLDGLDWDVEASSLNQSDVVYLSTQLKSIYGSDFAITFAPNGGNVGQYLPTAVACHQAGACDEYGQQFYDAVVSVGAAAGRIQEALNAGLPISKIGVGMMIGDASIYWTNAEARANMATLMSQFPGLQRAYLWVANRAGTSQWITDMRALIGY